MTAPRVLQVVLGLNPGGTERLVIELATRLHPQMPMAVCCLDEAGAWATQVEATGVRVQALGRAPGFHPSLGRGIAAIARRHGATVLHAHHYSPFVYSCCTRPAGLRTPIVFTEHGRLSDAGPSGKRRLVNHVLRRFPARVFGVSDDVRMHLVGEGFSANQVGVIYNGIDLGPEPNADARSSIRGTLGIADDAVVLGTIARLDPVKDLGTLLQAMQPVARELSLLLLVIGDGPERSTLEQQASTLGLDSHVKFLGHREDARAWLAGCDIFVNSSVSEGVSLTILEGMAATLPVIATAVGGTPEVVTSDCGVLVPSRDPAAFTAALRRLGSDRAHRRALGAAGRRRVVERFTLDRMIDDYARVYRALGAA